MVNVADPQDVRSKLADAESRLADVEREREHWTQLVARLRVIAGEADESTPALLPAPSDEEQPPAEKLPPGHMQELVVDVIEDHDDPLRARDVTAILREEGHEVSADSVSNALWYASEKAHRIVRVGRGLYARIAEAEPEPKQPGMTAAEAVGSTALGVATGAALAHAVRAFGAAAG